MSDQQQGGAGREETAALAQESITLRWEAHHMQAATIALNLRFDDTVRTLKSRGNDREAKEVLLRLAKELKTLNDGVVSRFTRLSAVNRTIVEILQKSKDGKAALMMRKAAELLVKGLANAEEEVHSLKATVTEVEAQRDHYKGLLAKTNAELETSQAYAQMSKAIGQEAGAASSSSSATTTTSSGGMAAGGDDGVIKKRPGKYGSGSGGKGTAPAGRQLRQRTGGVGAMSTSRPNNSGGGSGSGAAGDAPDISEAGAAQEEAPLGASVVNAEKGNQRTTAAAAARGGGGRAAIRAGASLGKADAKASSRSSRTTTTTATAATKAAPRRKRQREEAEAAAGGMGDEEEVDQGSRRTPSTGEKWATTQRGVEVPLSEPGGWSGGGDGGGEGIGEGGNGGGGVDEGEGGGGEGDVQSVYDSDDAPSMFF